MFVLYKESHDPSILAYVPPMDLPTRLFRVVRRVLLRRALQKYRHSAPFGLANFCDDRTFYAGDPWKFIPDHDVINLHWVAGFLDFHAFFNSLPRQTPVVWTLHDMAPFTGGCHWNETCPKFSQQCGACPQLGSHRESDWTRQVWKRKRTALANIPSRQLHIATPSRWLQEERRRSSLFSRFSGSVIPYGLDTEVFFPRDRRASRELLGLPPDAKIILFLAYGVHLPRKGLSILAEALSGIAPRSAGVLVSVGPGDPPVPSTLSHMHLGAIQEDRILSHVYSAADIFVAPSLHDNLPNTILESLACGTPVVAFDVGGIPDAVRPGVTGLLAKPGDPTSLRHAIAELLSDDQRRHEFSLNCRSIAIQEYSLGLQARRYVEVYKSMLTSVSGQRSGR